jgi:hypothetical protein
MRKLLLCCLLLACWNLSTRQSYAQVPSNVYTRVLMVQVGDKRGTAFTMEVDQRQYLVTAKHMVAGLKPEDSIEIFKGGQWSAINIKVFRCDDPVDIAVLVPPTQLTPTFSLEPVTMQHGYFVGQDAFFAGFPFGLSMPGRDLNGPFPFALVKKGTISAIVEEKGATVLLLDGHNNFGFSGGPMVYRDLNQTEVVFYLAGVVSGFFPELVRVTTPVEIKPGEDVSQVEAWRIVIEGGHKFKLEDTHQMVPLNTGIVRGYPIKYAVDLIHKHPIGPKITD